MEFLYNYQYDVAAFMLSSAIMIIYLTKMVPLDRSGRYFLALVTWSILTSMFSIVSMIAISDSTVPLWAAYVSTLGHAFLLNGFPVMYLQYIDSKYKIPKIKKTITMFTNITCIILATTIVTSPWTHAVAYFDANNAFRQGPVMSVLHIIPVVLCVMEILLIIVGRKTFNGPQVTSSIVFTTVTAAMTIIQLFYPMALICNFITSITLLFIYITYENPAYYTYKDTRFLNYRAFCQTLKRIAYDNKLDEYEIWLIQDSHSPETKQRQGSLYVSNIDNMAALKFHNFFGNSFFIFSRGIFAFIVNKKNKFNKNLTLNTIKEMHPDFNKEAILINDEHQTLSEIEKIVNYRTTHTNDKYKNYSSNYFVAEIERKNAETEKVIESIKRAIQNDSFVIYYQPIFDNKNGRFRSAEALIRCVDSEHGFINPESLITTAEKYGYIDSITDIVFEKVCKFISERDITKYGIDYIEINMSPENCKQKDLAEKLTTIRNKYNIPTSMINLEITETADIHDNVAVNDTLSKMNNNGIELSIDDYGSGFASPNYLIKIPVSMVKIDKEILWAAMSDESAMHILKSTINMLTGLGKKIVIEGVENGQMVDVLNSINNEMYFQGYYYSKPIPEEDFIKFIKYYQKEEEK